MQPTNEKETACYYAKFIKEKNNIIQESIESFGRCKEELPKATTEEEIIDIEVLFLKTIIALSINISTTWFEILFPSYYDEIVYYPHSYPIKVTYLDENAQVKHCNDITQILKMPKPSATAKIINSKIGIVIENNKQVYYTRVAIISSFVDFCERWETMLKSLIEHVPASKLDF